MAGKGFAFESTILTATPYTGILITKLIGEKTGIKPYLSFLLNSTLFMLFVRIY